MASRFDDVTSSAFYRSYKLEIDCITIAKGTHAAELRQAREARKGQRRVPGKRTDLIRQDYCNNIARFTAEEGISGKAALWMSKLDSSAGVKPEVRTFNAVLQSFARAGDFERAEAWFVRGTQSTLHPELEGMVPKGVDERTYEILIVNFAQYGDVMGAEKYMALSSNAGYRPSMKCFYTLVQACLKNKEPRRAHWWFEDLVQNGCSKRPNYSGSVVKAERANLDNVRSWSPDAHFDVAKQVIRSLAEAGNTSTANQWLKYLTECGLHPEDSPDVWAAVRSAHPLEIVSSQLSGERCHSRETAHSVPAWTRPALLNGELLAQRPGTAPVQRPSTLGALALEEVPRCSSAPAGGRRASSARSKSARGCVSPALRQVLLARSKGASPFARECAVQTLSAAMAVA